MLKEYKMIICAFKLFFMFMVAIIFLDCHFTAAAELKDSLLPKAAGKRLKRTISGNDLPPLPVTNQDNDDVPLTYGIPEGGNTQQNERGQDYTGTGTRNYGYRYVTSSVNPVQDTSESGTVNVGSDPQFEFRSHIDSSGQSVDRPDSNARDPTPSRRQGGYRYTSTVYSGPETHTAYRYRPPYSQLGSQQGTTNTDSQTQYSPYVGSGVNTNNPGRGSGVRYVGGGARIPVYNRNERVYGGNSRYIPNRGVVSSDPVCPTHSRQVIINNMRCTQAINTLGNFICYNYERVSRECCERCLALKNQSNTGCEYGDWSYQCRNMQAFDCYNNRNRDICCETCRRKKEQEGHQNIIGCEYGDLTPRCQIIREKRHLCYLPENQRLCCISCPSLANRAKRGCEWDDQNPYLCTPFDDQGKLRINCYMPAVQQICCASCDRVRSRVRDQIPGCEYGDKPVSFRTPYGILDCREYVGRFGFDVCSSPDVSTHCCYTCYRYRRQIESDGRGKK